MSFDNISGIVKGNLNGPTGANTNKTITLGNIYVPKIYLNGTHTSPGNMQLNASSTDIELITKSGTVKATDLYSLLQCGLKGYKVIWGKITSWTNKLATINTGFSTIASVSLTHYAHENNWGSEPSLTVRKIDRGYITVYVDNPDWHAFYIVIGY